MTPDTAGPFFAFPAHDHTSAFAHALVFSVIVNESLEIADRAREAFGGNPGMSLAVHDLELRVCALARERHSILGDWENTA